MIFENIDELDLFLAKNWLNENRLQLQEFIQKDFEISFLGASLINHKICIPGFIKKIREYPIGFGSSSYAYLSENDEKFVSNEMLKSLVKELQYVGLFSIEFMIKDNIAYFLEINLRNDGNSYIYTKAGANLPYIFYKSLNNIEVYDNECNIENPIYFMNDISDIRHILRGNLSLRKWLHDFHRTKVFLLFNKKDIKPFFYKFIYSII